MTIRTIGAASFQRVLEFSLPGFRPSKMFPRFDQAAFDAQKHWMVPEFVQAESDRLVGSVHSWLVRTPHHTILIDTCLGNHKSRTNPGWNNLDTPFLARLAEAGVQPEEVDLVMCTHLHVDHVGWNTRLVDGRWVPTFPNARYVMARKEYAHWEAERSQSEPGIVNDGSFDDSVLPVVEAGQAVFVDADHQPDDLFTIIEAPGHTPGSVVLRLAGGGQEALFTGDIMHHPIQVYHPDWSSQFCWDPALSAVTRRRVLEHCVEHNSLLCPAHFPGANAGFIRQKDDAFAIQWDVR